VTPIVLLFGIALEVSAATEYQIVRECDPASEVRALISKDSPIKIHFAIAGGATCYSVTATVDGMAVRGYVLDRELDAVIAFEKAVTAARQNLSDAPPALAPPTASVPDSAASATDTKKSPGQSEPVKEAPAETPKPAAKIEAPSH
jgi:hypothetical protein